MIIYLSKYHWLFLTLQLCRSVRYMTALYEHKSLVKKKTQIGGQILVQQITASQYRKDHKSTKKGATNYLGEAGTSSPLESLIEGKQALGDCWGDGDFTKGEQPGQGKGPVTWNSALEKW